MSDNKNQSDQPTLTVSAEPTKPALPRMAYTVKESAQILGLNQFTIYRLIARKLLKANTALRTKLIPDTELRRFLKV